MPLAKNEIWRSAESRPAADGPRVPATIASPRPSSVKSSGTPAVFPLSGKVSPRVGDPDATNIAHGMSWRQRVTV